MFFFLDVASLSFNLSPIKTNDKNAEAFEETRKVYIYKNWKFDCKVPTWQLFSVSVLASLANFSEIFLVLWSLLKLALLI